ncbi:MAG TPA: hypothetical protein VNT99_04600 [Methylomirabilota bacterium]|nr:hypothetical protein [Methylomirabilota bacterium]
MKTKMTSVCATLVLAAALAVNAADASKSTSSGGTPPSPQSGEGKHSKEFERMKTLVGTWKGTVDMGQGPIEMVSQYKLLAGGSVLEEKCFVGTPNEMTTMYYDKDGKLALTHYCMFGNRPSMLFKSADAKTIKFDFDKACGINPKKESHMHALSIRFDDADTITASCKAIMDGKEMEEKPTTLKRVKS